MFEVSKRTVIGASPAARIAEFARDERGATAIEYALMATGIGVTVATSVYSLGETVLVEFYNEIAIATSGE